MDAKEPIIWWVRRDLRLADNPALSRALESGAPVLPVFIFDEVMETHGALPAWRLSLGAEAVGRSLRAIGSRLILRRGPALETLRSLIAETGARQVVWSVLLDPDSKARDTKVKAGLNFDGGSVIRTSGHLLFDPWTVETGQGGFYRVYSPFWRAVKDRDVGAALPAVTQIPTPANWPASEEAEGWALGTRMRRGAEIVRPHLGIGEAVAEARLERFLCDRIDDYKARRDFPAEPATSFLSENLTYGEISPRRCWYAAQEAVLQGAKGAEHFLKELVWREFAYHLVYHTPQITDHNWRQDWDAFGWSEDESCPKVLAWKQGRTGIPFVDAAMREMYVTGNMHNRGRMIVGSYLTKHLMTHWRVGQRWFADCLRDGDPAANAMGWQWVAGSGPDAAPYFRVFNPVTQLEKFDPGHGYAGRWLAEGKANPAPEALDYFKAIPRSWGLTRDLPYPDPVVTVEDGRKRALAAYEARDF
jgi:deoxyribodipyrimidine photo-lyase